MSQPKSRLSRRTLFVGTGTAGAVAAAAALLPGAMVPAPATPQVQPPPERGGGYRLSDHVKQYYKTTRL